jgi:DNA polymerase-1
MIVANRKLFIIIDGNPYIHRAYHAFRNLYIKEYKRFSTVYGFLQFLFKLLNTFKPDYILICFDYPSKYFRHNIFEEYKSTRKPLAKELINQMKIIRNAVTALNIMQLEMKGYEADDLIATVVAKNSLHNNIQTIVVSGDKDVLQLINYDKVKVWDASKRLMYSTQQVQIKYGVLPIQLVDVFSLSGDIVDNIPGIKGIGIKTAVKLIQQFGSLENIFNNIDFIKGNVNKLLTLGKYKAIISKRLVQLKQNIPLYFNLEHFKNTNIDVKSSKAFFKKFNFDSFIVKYCYDNRINW